MARTVFFEALCPVNFGRSRRQICREDPFFLVFYQILEVTMILVQKVGISRLISGEDFFYSSTFLANDPLNVSFKKLSFFDPPYKKGSPTLIYTFDCKNTFFALPLVFVDENHFYLFENCSSHSPLKFITHLI